MTSVTAETSIISSPAAASQSANPFETLSQQDDQVWILFLFHYHMVVKSFKWFIGWRLNEWLVDVMLWLGLLIYINGIDLIFTLVMNYFDLGWNQKTSASCVWGEEETVVEKIALQSNLNKSWSQDTHYFSRHETAVLGLCKHFRFTKPKWNRIEIYFCYLNMH